MTRRQRILDFCWMPRTNAEIADLVCDHSGSVARDMAKLREDGLIANLNPGKGRKALYITELTHAPHHNRRHPEPPSR